MLCKVVTYPCLPYLIQNVHTNDSLEYSRLSPLWHSGRRVSPARMREYRTLELWEAAIFAVYTNESECVLYYQFVYKRCYEPDVHLNIFTAKAEITDFKRTPSPNSKVLMQCLVAGIPPPDVTWYLQNSKLPDKLNYRDYDVTASAELLVPAASLLSNSFLCNCTNPLDSVAKFARSKSIGIFLGGISHSSQNSDSISDQNTELLSSTFLWCYLSLYTRWF